MNKDLFYLLDQIEFRGICASVCPTGVGDSGFPYFREAHGTLMKSDENGGLFVRFGRQDEVIPKAILPENRQLPVFEGAYYGGCAPSKFLEEENVCCFVCARDPNKGGDYKFEVNYFSKDLIDFFSRVFPAFLNFILGFYSL